MAQRAIAWISWAGPWLVIALSVSSVIGSIGYFGSGKILGADFFTYLAASERLIDGEGLYLPTLLSGDATTTGAWQYLYPPLLAQLLIPLTPLPKEMAHLIYSIVSIALLSWAIASAWRIGGGKITYRGSIVAIAALLCFMPLYTALFNGNTGLLIGACVAASFTANPLIAGSIGGAIKVVPGALLAMVRRRDLTRNSVLAAVSVLAASALLAAGSWRTYLLEALPATLTNDDPIGQGGGPAALARLAGTIVHYSDQKLTDPVLIKALERIIDGEWTGYLSLDLLRFISTLEVPLRVGSLLLAALLLFAGLRAAHEVRRRHVAAAYLTVGSLLVPWTLWDHYLVAIFPLFFIGWALGDARARTMIALSGLLLTSPVTALVGAHAMAVPSMLLLLDGIRRTRLPETLPPKRPMPVEQRERR